jgi:AraC-like DNA-binding protein
MLGPPLNSLDGGPPRTRAATLVAGWWEAEVTGSGTVVPDGAVDLMWTADKTPWLAGPDTGPRPVESTPGSTVVAVRLQPGVASAVIGSALTDATDRTVSLDDVWPGNDVDRLVHSLGHAIDNVAAAKTLALAVARWVPQRWHADPIVVEAMAAIGAGRPVDRGGLGQRQFRRRFAETVGYGPSLYNRITRLDRASSLACRWPDLSLARLAAEAGYHDESHLARDSRALTGRPPSALRPGPTGPTTTVER